jgi:hypothetical protein
MDIDSSHSPFYEWLDHSEIRSVMHRALSLAPGERMVLMKGLVPGLVDEVGVDTFLAFMDELRAKAARYEDARTHPGKGHEFRQTPGERLGGPTPSGHEHLPGHRDANREGGRALERRMEAARWESLDSEDEESKP